MEILGISLLLYSMRFCPYSSVLSYLSHCMSKELFFVLSILMIINLQVHIPLWKKKVCILLVLMMLIIFLHFKYMCKMIYIYPYLLNQIILVILQRIKLIYYLLPSLLKLANSLLNLIFNSQIFSLDSDRRCLDLLGCHLSYILTLPTFLNIFPILLENAILQQRSIQNLFVISLIIFK